jgi:hypothetical protein
VIAGVLTFADAGTPSFSDRHRKDEELARLIESRGAKERVTTLLDGQATGKAVLQALAEAADASEPDATLVFYYAGHGDRDKQGAIRFLGYDERFSLADVEATIRKSFKGESVVLLADCCFSGGLGEVAAHLRAAGIEASALTSAEASNTSTVNWTFTQTVIDALSGEPLADRDADGAIVLGELAAESREALAYLDHQRAGVLLGHPAELVLSRPPTRVKRNAVGGSAFHVGDYVGIRQKGHRVTARIAASAGDDVTVSIFDYSDRTQITVVADQLERVTFDHYPVGRRLKVEWGGKLWPAEIKATDGDFHFITYPGWPDSPVTAEPRPRAVVQGPR